MTETTIKDSQIRSQLLPAFSVPYTPTDAVKGGMLRKIEELSASNSTEIDFTSNIDDMGTEYRIYITDIVAQTGGSNLLMRTSTDGGSSFDSGASDYQYVNRVLVTGGSGAVNTSSGATSINITSHANTNISSTSGDGSTFVISVFVPASTSKTKVKYEGTGFNNSATFFDMSGAAVRDSAADVDGLRFVMSSGNIASGKFELFRVLT